MASKNEIAKLLFVLASAYQVELTESVVLAYSLALEKFKGEEIADATKFAIQNLERMPPPATIAKIIGEQRTKKNKNMTRETAFEMMRTEAAKSFRSRHPNATANDVADFLQSYDERVSRRLLGLTATVQGDAHERIS